MHGSVKFTESLRNTSPKHAHGSFYLILQNFSSTSKLLYHQILCFEWRIFSLDS